ncbi:MAG: thermonuclease family protein [Erysipelotrichales bacterium]|nr:thermonuclease family protein [Erysipelotrichales bacterium]
MKSTKKIFVFFASALLLLTGCGGGSSSNSTPVDSTPNSTLGPEDLNTEQTDKLKLQRSYENKNFIEDGIGVATFRSHTDGDTTNWWIGTEKIKMRYLGVNTPESTAKIEPWGLAASDYTNSKTSKAKLIVLENDVEAFGQKDNNGTRYLGFVWYSMSGDPADLRLLNLELVELGYSLNQLQIRSELCPYYEYFVAAENHARACHAKIHGELDISFDYTKSVYNITIYELRKNYYSYGKVEANNDEGLPASSGKQLRIKALVVGMIGDNMVLRDLVLDANDQDEGDMLASIYAYAGYNTSLAGSVKVGDVVQFYCRATKFNGTMQLSDLQTSFIDRSKPFKVLTHLDGPTEEYPQADLQPYEMDTSKFNTAFKNDTRYGDFEKYAYEFVKTRVTIRTIESGDYDEDGNLIEGTEFTGYYKQDDNRNYTCYGNSQAYYHSNTYGDQWLTLNLRVDGSAYPRIEPEFFQVGHTYECYGYLAPYFDKYQLMLFNNTNASYVVDVTDQL